MARNSDVASHTLIRQRYPILSQALYLCYAECNKRAPGSGCAAIHCYNTIHAILGASEHCIATHPAILRLRSRLSTGNPILRGTPTGN
jgi:xanthine dehydrogenase YagS FAD-binding subunit